MGAKSVSATDLTRLRDILDVTREERRKSAEQAMFDVLGMLRELVGSDGAVFNHHDSLNMYARYSQLVDGRVSVVVPPEQLAAERLAPGYELLKSGWWSNPCSLIERTGRPLVSSTLSWMSARQWANDPLHHEYLTYEDEIFMGVPSGTFNSLRILLARVEGPPFGERELTLMTLLLPHLEPLMRAVIESLPANTESAPPEPLLTERQREILTLVRLGMPNRRIGRILGISEATVRKHLENAYLRLGVQSRTAAVAAAFPDPGLADRALRTG